MGVLKNIGKSIKNAGEDILDAVDEVVKRPSKRKGYTKGQLPPGVLTNNIGSNLGIVNGKDKNLDNVGSDLGIIKSGYGESNYTNHADDINLKRHNYITPDELTKNIGANLGQQYMQTFPGFITSNIGNNKMKNYDIKQDMPGKLTNNIGNNDIDDNDIKQSNPGIITDNIGSNLGDQFMQTKPGFITSNIGNNDIDDNDIKQDDPGILTTNIKNNNITEHNIQQDKAGVLTTNIGNAKIDDADIKQDKAGILTKNIKNTELKNNLFDQSTIDKSNEFRQENDNKKIKEQDLKQDKAGILTKNISSNSLKENDSIQDKPGILTNNIGNKGLDESLFTQDVKTGNVGNRSLNDPLFTGIEFEQQPGDTLDKETIKYIKNTENIGNESLKEKSIFNKDSITSNIGNKALEDKIIQDSNVSKDLSSIKQTIYDNNTKSENIGNKSLNDILFEPKNIEHTLNNDVLFVEPDKKTNKLDNQELFKNEKNLNQKNDLDSIYEQNKLGELTENIGNNLGENDIEVAPKEEFKKETLYKYSEEKPRKLNLKQLFDNQIKRKTDAKNDIGSLYTAKGDVEINDVSVNIGGPESTITEKVFSNITPLNTTTPTNTTTPIATPVTPTPVNKMPTTLFDNVVASRKVQLDEITTKMSNRKNIGVDLGTI